MVVLGTSKIQESHGINKFKIEASNDYTLILCECIRHMEVLYDALDDKEIFRPSNTISIIQSIRKRKRAKHLRILRMHTTDS